MIYLDYKIWITFYAQETWSLLYLAQDVLGVSFQVKKLLNKVILRESCFYRKLTDASQDEENTEEVEVPQEDMLGRYWFY